MCVPSHVQAYSPYRTLQSNPRVSQVFQFGTNFDYVIHTASPYNFKVDNPVDDFLNPAIKGTTGILKSIKAHGPSVKRVVITSSSAAIINPLNHEKVYDETKWAPFAWDDAISKPQFGYPASKVNLYAQGPRDLSKDATGARN